MTLRWLYQPRVLLLLCLNEKPSQKSPRLSLLQSLTRPMKLKKQPRRCPRHNLKFSQQSPNSIHKWHQLQDRWNRLSTRKKRIIIGVAIASLALLGLIIGLAVGLKRRRGKGYVHLGIPSTFLLPIPCILSSFLNPKWLKKTTDDLTITKARTSLFLHPMAALIPATDLL